MHRNLFLHLPAYMSTHYLEEELTPLQKMIKKHGVHIAMAATSAGLFIGIPLLFWIASVTAIDVALLLILIFVCGGVGLLQWRWVYRFLDMNYYQFAMYAYSGFGMCLINFLLLINLWIPISQHSTVYRIKHVSVYNREFRVSLEEDVGIALESFVSEYMNKQFETMPPVENVTVNYNMGILGIDTFGSCSFE